MKTLSVVFLTCFVLAPLAVLIAGCSSDPPFTAYRIHHVKRVFAHGVGSYSVMTENDKTKEIKHEFVTSSTRKAKLVADLKEGEEIWVEVEKELATIHLHSSDEVTVEPKAK